MHCSFDSEKAGDREVQRTMLELLNQLDGFQPNTQVKVGKENAAQQLGWPSSGTDRVRTVFPTPWATSC